MLILGSDRKPVIHMTTTIRRATLFDLAGVARLYEEIHDAQARGRVTTGWLRGVYPTRETAEAALQRGDLFVLEEDNRILGAAVINALQVDVYARAPWAFEAAEEEVCVLHTLVISPRHSGKGLGRRFVAFYEDFARERGCRVLRLDTNERNERARAMYRRLGYREAAILPTVFNGIPDVRLVLLEKKLDT